MALIRMNLDSERWLDEVLFTANSANTAGADFDDGFLPPLGVGDTAIMEMILDLTNLLTLVTPTDLGVQCFILNAAGDKVVDFVGTFKVRKVAANRNSAHLSPDPLVLLRQDEQIRLQFPEMDSNAAPTGDVTLYVKAVRVRPVAGAPGPIRLVA